MPQIKIGLVGLDTSHCERFTEILNYEGEQGVPGGRIVGAYPGGSQLCAISRDRVAGFTESIRDKHGVRIYDSIEALGQDVEAFALTSGMVMHRAPPRARDSSEPANVYTTRSCPRASVRRAARSVGDVCSDSSTSTTPWRCCSAAMVRWLRLYSRM